MMLFLLFAEQFAFVTCSRFAGPLHYWRYAHSNDFITFSLLKSSCAHLLRAHRSLLFVLILCFSITLTSICSFDMFQVFADRFPRQTLLIPVGGSSLAYRWWMYPPLHQQQQQQQQQIIREDLATQHRKLLSAVSSTKNETDGHKFRLEVVEFIERQTLITADVFGWGRRPARDIG
jgi:hypothetical protein